MEFEWNPAKNEANIKKHGIYFEDAYQILEGSHVVFESFRDTEERWGAIGLLDNRCVIVFYTMRSTKYRIISIRRARPDEERRYRQLYQ
jgi:uncharacterized DUF497 family protein